MSQVYNFSAGPAMLPKQVLQVMQDELLECNKLIGTMEN
jgi:phosphoserine aminotransferase